MQHDHPAAGTTDHDTARDTFDLLGFQADVGAPAGTPRMVIRRILRGFGPVDRPAGAVRPSFDLMEGSTGEWRVRAGGEILHVGDDLVVALGQLEWRIVTAALEYRGDLFHLHASALCLPTRRDGLVLLGGSGRGKTTLTMGLMLRGFVPFADDVALLDPETLELTAFRRAFHLSDGTWPLLEPLAEGLAPEREDLPGYFSPPQWAEHPAPVRWILLPEYRPQQVPELIRLSPSEAASAIVEQTLSLARRPRMALAAAARLTNHARCYRFLCGDLADSVAMVQRLVEPVPA